MLPATSFDLKLRTRILSSTMWRGVGGGGWVGCRHGLLVRAFSRCRRRHMCRVEFGPRGFSPATAVFSSPKKPTFPTSNSMWHGRRRTNLQMWHHWNYYSQLTFFMFVRGCLLFYCLLSVMFFDHFCRCCIVRLPNFHGIVTSFEQYPRDWNLWYTSSEPENTPLPGNQELFIR